MGLGIGPANKGQRRIWVRSVLWLGLLLFGSSSAWAVPRYSARYEQNCHLCHHNPSGGGMRSLYASQYLVPMEMVLKPYSEEKLEKIQPQVSNSVTIGTDIRTIYHYSDKNRSYRNFFQMQGDLYVLLQTDERFSAYLDQGMDKSLELFGLGYVLPWNGYVKMGRFLPPVGWRFSDHLHFVRHMDGTSDLRGLQFTPPGTDVGLELGVYPGRLALQAAVLNGAPSSQPVPLDVDTKVALAGTTLYRMNLAGVGIGLGGSVWRNKTPQQTVTTGGPIWYLKWKRLIWEGETDWSKRESPPPLGEDEPVERTEWATSQEGTFQLKRGLDLRVIFDYYDPDLDLKTGTRSRAGIGLDALLVPFVGFQAMYNRYDTKKGTDISLPEYDEFELLMHLFY